MTTNRSPAGTRSTMHRLFLMVGIAVALIAGLLAMHTLTADTGHAESPAISSADTGHCLGDCDAPGNMPNHSMPMMVCVLALLAAVIVVLAPALLARLSGSLGVVVPAAGVPRALPRPRPPSLFVLSISRT